MRSENRNPLLDEDGKDTANSLCIRPLRNKLFPNTYFLDSAVIFFSSGTELQGFQGTHALWKNNFITLFVATVMDNESRAQTREVTDYLL